MNTQLLKPANFVGAEPVRQDITILPAQDSSKLRLGWVVFESEEEYQKYIKTKDGKKALKAYLQRNNPKRRKETDIVDQYRVYHHAEFIKPTSTGIRCVEVLQQFKGKLFNNELNNWLSTLRPSAVKPLERQRIQWAKKYFEDMTVVSVFDAPLKVTTPLD